MNVCGLLHQRALTGPTAAVRLRYSMCREVTTITVPEVLVFDMDKVTHLVLGSDGILDGTTDALKPTWPRGLPNLYQYALKREAVREGWLEQLRIRGEVVKAAAKAVSDIVTQGAEAAPGTVAERLVLGCRAREDPDDCTVIYVRLTGLGAMHRAAKSGVPVLEA